MASKIMLDKQDEVETSVTHEDQKMINTFGRLNNRKHELLKQKKYLEEDLEKARDAQDDIFLAEDEDIKYKYLMGEAYMETPKEETEELLEKYINSLESDIEKINAELESIAEAHKELKVLLYGRFKSSINLEE
ncbi:prefoldin beta-like domain containing protein [Heterostelium album PN500]|uniref:Prefoldin subunit 4 n=1 Tax=Heterostelium pallidum (strain ATCC 26659 / Pp 5 / PN500) TaxID=670386 RepID=D3BE21_HETP5|nr:prefoldin beta-like domain containing protein [Heterostelium album PN500]EFA80152.1 prefoldin beta-like domain containing protein [Heterostelium album PN500]|eukprot:XP_020432272.1 prefoldin beta-like domain containing protein [Heterostelium album PN500]